MEASRRAEGFPGQRLVVVPSEVVEMGELDIEKLPGEAEKEGDKGERAAVEFLYRGHEGRGISRAVAEEAGAA